MFDDNNIDKIMKSILENAQEDVPAHIWEGVSAGLDKASRHKRVVIWWRRASIGVAAAAIIIMGLMFTVDKGEHSPHDFNSQNDDFIAVVERVSPEEVLIAEVDAPEPMSPSANYRTSSITQAHEATSNDIIKKEVSENDTIPSQEDAQKVIPSTKVQKPERSTGTFKQSDLATLEDFEEEFTDYEKRRPATSLVLAGITGTNSGQNGPRANLMKRPSLSTSPAKTGITETSTNTAYGIPVSAGVGVKIDFSDRWSLGVGVNYSYLSRKFYGTYTKADGNGMEISSTASDIKNSQHFVGIPINAYYNILNNKHVNLYAYAGGTVEKCITDKYNVLVTSIVHTEKPEGLQFSANAGIGVEFMLGNHLGLYVDPSLRYYFDNAQPKSIRTAQPLMLGFEMGLRIRL